MSNLAHRLLGPQGARYLRSGDALPRSFAKPGWNRETLAGRLVELRSESSSGAMTAAVGLVAQAQRDGETTVWVTTEESLFYPPDVVESGVDLEALTVVRVPGREAIPRAADKLARSGGFGLIVLDLVDPFARVEEGRPVKLPQGARSSGRSRRPFVVPAPLQSRLLGFAQKFGAAVVFVTGGESGLGSLVSLRARAERRRLEPDRFQVEIRALKDKRRAPGWTFEEHCRGPVGLR